MTILKNSEKNILKNDIRKIIESTGDFLKILRPEKTGQNSFYGSKQTGLAVITDSVICEKIDLLPDNTVSKEHDLIVNIPPETDIKEDDLIEYKSTRYKVTDIVKHNCFGAITHLELKTERDKRETD